MMICTPIGVCAKSVVRLSGFVQRQMSNYVCGVVSQAPSSSCCFSFSTGHSKPKYVDLSVSKTNSCSPVISFQAFQGSCFGSGKSNQRGCLHSLTIGSAVSSRRPQKTCLDISLGCQNMAMRLSVPKQGIIPKIRCKVGPVSWPEGCASAGLIFGLLVCYSSSEPVHAEAAQAKENKEDDCDSSSVNFSHGKKVYTDYSVIGIPGDGRCLFRSVAHGACLRSGRPAPAESHQRELADELRAKVANEFVKRRKETEWFIEGDFDTYVSQIRKPHVWGGEPELLMASHVLQMPITVYMHDADSGGLISIAEYGQEYGKENPIRVLYHGFGHYDSLQIPGKKGPKSRL
uniref:Ubiquitin thioesterase OTU n=1 Tax=Davidia involucrata TaxID=16924 RepID=A0A5B7BGV4_DAVIN